VKIYKSQEQKELLKMGNRVFIDTEECTGCETCVGTIGVGPREPIEIYGLTFQK
jgi:NAD-dependent dihydropyrimidine dehydrogenase PreA subunit